MRRLYILGLAQNAVVGFLLAGPAAVIKEIGDDFGSTPAALGILGSVFFVGYAAMQIPTGMLVDAQGARRTLLQSALLMAAGSIAFGLSPSYPWALLTRCITGVGAGMVFVPLVAIISQSRLRARFGLYYALLTTLGMGVGIILASLPLPLAAARFGWRAPFVVMGLVTLVVLTPLLRMAAGGSPGQAKTDRPPILEQLQKGFKVWYRSRALWVYSLTLFLVNGGFLAFQGLWAGPYALSILRLSQDQLGVFLLFMPLGAILGYPMAGLASDRLQRRAPLIFAGCGLCCLMWVSLLAHLFGLAVWPPQLAVAMLAGLMGTIGLGMGLIPSLTPPPLLGVVVGIINTSPFLGVAAFQVLIGVFLDGKSDGSDFGAYGFAVAFGLLAVAAAVAAALSLLVRDQPRASEKRPGST